MRFLFAMLLAALVNPSVAAQPTENLEPERLLFLLEYIGVDYGDAVRDGKIADPFEYQEMTAFSALLTQQFQVLRSHGAAEDVRGDLLRLQELILTLRPPEDVRELVGALTERLYRELMIVSAPSSTPDPRRGEALYADNCAPCHGLAGAGDGFGDPEMDPPASSFRNERINLLSTHQVYGATNFGIEGTAMPSYRDALSPEALWDIAFHVMTLREDFEPAPTAPAARLSLDDLIFRSNRELLALHEAADVDFYRRNPPEMSVTRPVPQDDAPETPALNVALQLQDAFAAVADRVLPSVVNVTAFERGTLEQEKNADAEAWQVASAEARLYPGFLPARSGSGFFVSDDGYLLTALAPLLHDDGQTAQVIDVELPGGRHVLSRLVGAEPTINLAVLKLEIVSAHRPPETPPVTIGNSEAVRVGHWTIAVGDPRGAERTYAVGTLAARAARQCYQEELSGTLMQAALSIHPESYGGPLVDIRGQVVGMTVPMPGVTPTGVRATEFALPINLAMNIYQALKVAESKTSPWLGFSVLDLAAIHRRARDSGEQPVLPRTGVYIDDLFEPSPAATAGVRVGDCLVAIDGNRLFSVLDFQKWLYLSGIGRTIKLELFRAGETLERQVTIEERPPTATTR